MNDALAHGRVFFMEIRKDGIALYEADDHDLHQPRPKTPQQALVAGREYFDEGFPSAMKRYEGAQFYLQKGYLSASSSSS